MKISITCELCNSVIEKDYLDYIIQDNNSEELHCNQQNCNAVYAFHSENNKMDIFIALTTDGGAVADTSDSHIMSDVFTCDCGLKNLISDKYSGYTCQGCNSFYRFCLGCNEWHLTKIMYKYGVKECYCLDQYKSFLKEDMTKEERKKIEHAIEVIEKRLQA